MDNDPHAPHRADQIGHDLPIGSAGEINSGGRLPVERATALQLAIQSFGAPINGFSATTFIERAKLFEDYLATGKTLRPPTKPAELAGSRAYEDDGNGGFRAV